MPTDSILLQKFIRLYEIRASIYILIIQFRVIDPVIDVYADRLFKQDEFQTV